jgi:hypothetical protein
MTRQLNRSSDSSPVDPVDPVDPLLLSQFTGFSKASLTLFIVIVLSKYQVQWLATNRNACVFLAGLDFHFHPIAQHGILKRNNSCCPVKHMSSKQFFEPREKPISKDPWDPWDRQYRQYQLLCTQQNKRQSWKLVSLEPQVNTQSSKIGFTNGAKLYTTKYTTKRQNTN